MYNFCDLLLFRMGKKENNIICKYKRSKTMSHKLYIFENHFLQKGTVMTYFILDGNRETIYEIAHDMIGCRCQPGTPVCISIPKINPDELTPQERRNFSMNDFVLACYCSGCRKRTKLMVPLDKIPHVDTDAILQIARQMSTEGINCNHDRESWEVTAPVIRDDAPSQIDLNGVRLLLHIVYCVKCRHLVHVYITEAHRVY